MIVYLHGFNSSPQSHKAQLLGRYLEARGLGAEYACPALPPLASDAVGEIEKLIKQNAGVGFVG
ncbi:MAG TPA: YqiA/YcfP family alpha/beta fold hydrolase, partial [Burkholderiales bacterium]|nr:YqiA/YcfP family alpha/beta fold hydrolase [Burkholderiales bacterium]